MWTRDTSGWWTLIWRKFFDRVNHQRLMSVLKAKVVLPDGVVVGTDEGMPQGGPLSPLLSNVVLDELDSELERRGHRFVRYADDCNVYVRSERGGAARDGEHQAVH